MIDSKTIKQNNEYDARGNLNFQVEDSEMDGSKFQNERLSTNEDNLNTERMLSFEEVVSSNLS